MQNLSDYRGPAQKRMSVALFSAAFFYAIILAYLGALMLCR